MQTGVKSGLKVVWYTGISFRRHVQRIHPFHLKLHLLTGVALMFFISCRSGDSEVADSGLKPIAKAGKEVLSEEEFNTIFVDNGVAKDSAVNAKRSVENWAVESLLYQEALEKLDKEDVNIEKRVEEYRKELVNHIYSTRIIEANLDTLITAEEVEDYYNAHRDNFILKENLVKLNYIKVPVKSQGLDKIKRLLMSGPAMDMNQLKLICSQVAENYFLNDSTWLYVDELKKEIPKLKEEPDFNLVNGRVMQFTDDYYFYYLKIKDIKVKNSLSPLNFERQNIQKFIINNRKTQLITQYKQLLLERAKSGGNFVAY